MVDALVYGPINMLQLLFFLYKSYLSYKMGHRIRPILLVYCCYGNINKLFWKNFSRNMFSSMKRII